MKRSGFENASFELDTLTAHMEIEVTWEDGDDLETQINEIRRVADTLNEPQIGGMGGSVCIYGSRPMTNQEYDKVVAGFVRDRSVGLLFSWSDEKYDALVAKHAAHVAQRS